jgi:hypothetical protein
MQAFSGGEVRKVKSRFCTQGDRQLEGINYVKTYAPDLYWQTVQIMLVTSQLMGKLLKQVHYTASFRHVDIDQNPEWDMMLTEGRNQSVVSLEPLSVFYVDDASLHAENMEDRNIAIEAIEDADMHLEVEDYMSGFLAVLIAAKIMGTIHITQVSLANRIIKALNIRDILIKRTLAEYGCLEGKMSGKPPLGTSSYLLVIGMLQYLQGHSKPDITLAVSQCSKYAHGLKRQEKLWNGLVNT